MHELSIAEGIVRVVETHARGRRVTAVAVQAGALRQVVPAALEFAFELVARGTCAEDAALELEVVDAAVWCRSCGTDSIVRAFPLGCHACGAVDVEVIAGEELLVESVELESEPAAAGGKGGR